MIHFVIPVYNETPNVAKVVTLIVDRLESIGLPYRVVVVDDGSTDGTADAYHRCATAGHPIELIVHATNQGPGAAFRTGFLHVLKDAAPLDVVVTMEGDGTSDLSVLPRMLRRVWEEGDHIVLASCYLYGGGIRSAPLYRVVLSHVANAFMRKALGLSGLATLSSFYRVYQVAILRALHARHGPRFITSQGFECMVEVLYRAAQLGARISEVPIVLDGSRRGGPSKMKTFKTSLAYLRLGSRGLLGRL